MPSKVEQVEARRQRLTQFFLKERETWRDLVEEIRVCKYNAMEKMINIGCEDREYYAGKAAGFEEIIAIGDV